MRLRVVLCVLVLLTVGVLAEWALSADEAEAPAAAGEQPEAAEAKAEGEVAAAEGEEEAEAEEAEEAEEKLSGWLFEIKMNRGGSRRLREGTLKLTPTRMRREGLVEGFNRHIIIDSEAGVTYAVTTRQAPSSREAEEVTLYFAEKYPWSAMDSSRRATIDDAVQNARMGMREAGSLGEVYRKQVERLETFKKPAQIEATEDTKKFGDYEAVKYTITLGEDLAKGVVWVTKDLDIDAPIGAMLAHAQEIGGGGLPFLAQLDELDGFPLRLNLQYYLPGKRSPRKLNLWFEKVTETEFDPSEFEIPAGAELSEPMSSRAAFRRGMRPPTEAPTGPQQRPPEMGR